MNHHESRDLNILMQIYAWICTPTFSVLSISVCCVISICRLHWNMPVLRKPAGMRILQMYITNWSTLQPQRPSSIWSTVTLSASRSLSVRETWNSRNFKRGVWVLLQFCLRKENVKVVIWMIWTYSLVSRCKD